MSQFGKLVFNEADRRWIITDLAPHVAIMLKRLFPRVPEYAVTVDLSDTDETRADIHWFLQRFPLAHSVGAHEELERGCARIALRAAERGKILLPEWTPGETPGFINGKQPYRFQAQNAAIAIANPSLLVCDEVGFGKTITAAATFTSGAPLPAAMVVEPHLATQWQRRLREFTNLRVHTVKGRRPYTLAGTDVYIYRYSNVAGWVDVFDKGVFPTVGYDEIQQLRHGTETAKGQACKILSANAEVRLGLTATPIYNYGDEMHAVMDFVKPGLLGDRDEFLREWCGSGRVVKNPDALGAYLRDTGYFIRHDEDDPDVDASLPPLNLLEWEVEFDEDLASKEEDLARRLAMKVLHGSFAESGQAARELDARMRQVTGVAKARSVAAYVRMLLSDTPRVLVAGWHREVYSIWQQELSRFNPVLYTGTETTRQKDRAVDEFCTGDARVMFISLRSGAGLDGLQHHCWEGVVGELDWSPQVHKQFFGRLRRPGMDINRPVNGHYLHCNGGSDPVLLETLGIKTDQSRGIIQPGRQLKARYSDESRIQRLATHVLEKGLAG